MDEQQLTLFDEEDPFASFRLEKDKMYEVEGVPCKFVRVDLAPRGTPPELWDDQTEYLFQRDRDLSIVRYTESRIEQLVDASQFFAAFEGERLPRWVPPDGPTDPMAKARQWWCERFDEHMPWQSQSSLDRFVLDMVEKYQEDLVFKAFPKVPDPWTICDWAEKRGHCGWRPLFLMGSKKVDNRCKFPKTVEAVLGEEVAHCWASSTYTPTDACASVKVRIARLNEEIKATGGRALPTPSQATVFRRAANAERRETWACKHEENNARRRYDGTLELPMPTRILDAVMIDSTPGDTVLVLDKDLLPLGRPTVNFALDLYSRVSLAVFVTFEDANIHVAMATLKRTLKPKLPAVLDNPRMKITLSPYGKPRTVIVDNAWAQVGASYRDACHDLGIDLRFAPIRTPEAKAYVERFIGTITRLVFQKAAGGIPYNPVALRKLGYDPKKTMILDIYEFEERLMDALHFYHLDTHDGIGGVPPIVKWRASAKLHSIEVCRDPDYIDRAAGEFRMASLTRQGIKLDGIVYHDPQVVTRLMSNLAPQDPLHSKRRTSIRARVKIKRNPADLTKIHVWDSVDEDYAALPARHARFLTNLTKSQYLAIKTLAALADMPFNTELECAEARTRLIRKLEADNPDRMKSIEKKMQRLLLVDQRGLPPGNTLQIATAHARHDGMAPVEDDDGVAYVPIDPPRRANGGMPAKNARRGGVKATEKAMRTRRKSRALIDAEAAEVEATKAAFELLPPPELRTVIPRMARAEDSYDGDETPRRAQGGSRREALKAKMKQSGWGEGSAGMAQENEDGR